MYHTCFEHKQLVYVHLLPDLLEAVEHRNTRDAVDLTERVQTDWEQLVLACYPGILDDGTS